MTTTAPPATRLVRDGSVIRKDTAVLVRRRLAAAFPGVKFSVRAGGQRSSAINVSWTDGPTEPAVKAVTDVYSGIGFDGMTDSTTHSYAWLYPDGTAERVAAGPGEGYGTYDLAGNRLADDEANDYRRGLRLGSGVTNTSLHGVDQTSPAYARGLADGAAMAAKSAHYVCFYATVMTYRERSAEYDAELAAAVLFLARGLPAGYRAGPFSYNDRYDLAVPSSIAAGNWEGYGSDLVWRLSRLEPDVLAAVLAQEAERRAHNAAVRFSDGANGCRDDGDIVTGYYVTAAEGRQVVPLLGPFATRGEAEGQVDTARQLAAQVDPAAAAFAGFGVTRARSKPVTRPDRSLPAGRLERLPARQLALAGLA
jgi:hypothetical protein